MNFEFFEVFLFGFYFSIGFFLGKTLMSFALGIPYILLKKYLGVKDEDVKIKVQFEKDVIKNELNEISNNSKIE